MQVTDQAELNAYKKRYNFLGTPPELAQKMVSFLEGVGRDALILEPSASKGALIRAALKHFRYPLHFNYCEIQEVFAGYLAAYNKVAGDFLEYHPGPIYDAVLMNPPYRNKQAERHVDHAWECIKPGGRIVALTGEKGAAFIDEEFSGHVFHRERIYKGFKETSIDTFLFLIHKPLNN